MVEPLDQYRQVLFEKVSYKPNEWQEKIFADLHRVKLVAGGWRAGKSHTLAKEALLWVPRSNLIWLAGNEFGNARQEFEYLMTDLAKLGLLQGTPSFPKEGPCSLACINGCKVETKSVKEPVKIGMAAPDWIGVCEAGQIEYDAYLRLRGRLAEKGASMVLSGTFETAFGWYPDLFKRGQGVDPEVKSFSLPSWSNIAIFPGGYDPKTRKGNAEIVALANELTPDLFALYVAAQPVKPASVIMQEFDNEIHVGDYPYDPDVAVEIAVDPGYGFPGAYAVLAIQVIEGSPRLVDEIYLQHYTTEEMCLIVKQRPWGGKVHSGAIDIAGKQHQAMAAPIEVWLDNVKGLGIHLDSQYVEVEGGIELLRTFLKVNPVTRRPKLLIDRKCKGFIAECGGGKSPVAGGGYWERDLETGKIIDKNNHATKAVIYWLVNRYGYTARKYDNDYGRVYKLDGNGGNKWLKRKISIH